MKPTLTERNKRIIDAYYQSLSRGDSATFKSLHAEDVVFNFVGRTPLSGRHVGREKCFKLLSRYVIAALVPGEYQFAKKWRIMAADEKCVVAIMKGGGAAKNGSNYEQTYCQVFTIAEDKICEIHEFFDTVLVEEALFDCRLEKPEKDPTEPFQF
jgi:ketosteroid isomerase-like protein